jgi:signal transduction histidine kinase
METDRLPPLLQATIFRIIREAVNNARRHAEATQVDIRLTQIGAQHLLIEIQDDGRGFNPRKVPRDRFGLTGIRERARLFGGGASIESRPDRGTRLTVKLALDPPLSDEGSGERPGWTWTV